MYLKKLFELCLKLKDIISGLTEKFIKKIANREHSEIQLSKK
jgi:hypothetical protein